MKRWSHGHSIGTGAVLGLMLTRRPELIFAAGIACGVLLVGGIRLYRTLLSAFEAWRSASRAKRQTIASRPISHYSSRSDRIPF